MRVKIFVRLKSGVLDVQGKTVEQGLLGMGFEAVSNVRVGKLIELDIDSSDADYVRSQVKEYCDKLLVNPVIESYEIGQFPEVK
jgi:phosphoribosylformylglycinamidine synthase subunit PurS